MSENFKKLLTNQDFLEIYGRLLGDGWLGIYDFTLLTKKKKNYIIGFCGHLEKDREFINDTRKKFNDLFGRSGFLILKPKYNAIELRFGYKELLYFFNNSLDFPIGKKIDLRIHTRIPKKRIFWIPIIRGIFDTDGSFFLDKNFGKIYPQIEFHMKAPYLLEQLASFLRSEGYRLTQRPDRIRLKGIKQIQKWMKEIGSSNPKHILRYQNWLFKYGPVAQPGLERQILKEVEPPKL